MNHNELALTVFLLRDFLLFESPLGELDLVREEIANIQCMV